MTDIPPITTSIKHQISSVAECVCKSCAHNWQGECRAYCRPLSDAERKRRTDRPTMCEHADLGIPLCPDK